MAETLDDFCDGLMKGANPLKALQPEPLAEVFSHYFAIPLRISTEDLSLLLETAGIGMVLAGDLPNGLRGVHYTLPDGRYAIRYLENQWEGGKVHTLFHETYEIICEMLWDRCLGQPPQGDICPLADRFAAAVMMPAGVFAAYAQASGLDLLELQRNFRCAYLSAARRLGEVMGHQPLAVALYERRGGQQGAWPGPPGPGEFRATAVIRTPGFREGRSRLLCGNRVRPLAPFRPPGQGSLAEQVILTGVAEYAEEEPGEAAGSNEGLAVAARPVFWGGNLSKVAVVAVPHRDRSVLEPQLQRVVSLSREAQAQRLPASAMP